MRLLFLSIGDMPSIRYHEIYPDLLREFMRHGDEVYVVCAREKRENLPTELVEEDGAKLLKVRIGNITKTNLIEKGISTLLIEQQFKRAIKKHLSDIRFDMVMYSTPPITFVGVVDYIKKRDNATSYLLLKDIFPQNALDLGMLKKAGLKGLIYSFFRTKEKRLYALSDRIGCMSNANVAYVLAHNPQIPNDNVEVCPNCVEIQDTSVDSETWINIRNKYNIPLNKKVFVYGGNLGKPQTIPFIIQCLKASKVLADRAHFLIVGDGTDFQTLQQYITDEQPTYVTLMKRLPKEDFDKMIAACDFGMIFLDHRFTIPNYPSRLLAYMQAGIPVLACTDSNTDIGLDIENGGFGWWCESNNTEAFVQMITKAVQEDTTQMVIKEKKYLEEHFSVQRAYNIIMNGR